MLKAFARGSDDLIRYVEDIESASRKESENFFAFWFERHRRFLDAIVLAGQKELPPADPKWLEIERAIEGLWSCSQPSPQSLNTNFLKTGAEYCRNTGRVDLATRLDVVLRTYAQMETFKAQARADLRAKIALARATRVPSDSVGMQEPAAARGTVMRGRLPGRRLKIRPANAVLH